MAKQSGIDAAIERLEAKRTVLELAIAELRQQQTAKAERVPRVRKAKKAAGLPKGDGL